jgi:TRAP-type C4-dicarboxylate transport system permease small subunit
MSKSLTFATRGSQLLAWCGGALMLLSAALITLDVLARNIFASTFFESFEISTYALAATVSFGMAYALSTKAHIRIEVLYILFPPSIRRALDIVAITALLAVSLFLTWFGFQTLADSWALGARSNSAMSVPLAVPQTFWVAGLAWFSVTCVVLAARTFVHLARGRTDAVEKEVGIASLAEEIAASTEPPLSGLPVSPAVERG